MAALLLLTRLPAPAQYLSIDNVNLALALEKFDPRSHQPQPPGYPFFVGFSRLVNIFFDDAEKTFHAVSLLTAAACLPAAAALGRRMFDAWCGHAAALLLLLNPVFWYSGLEGPLRPFLALFSLLTAYCALRAWSGEQRYVVWGALAVGVGSGFRPDLLAFLLPLWLVSAWFGTRSSKHLLIGAGALFVSIACWVGSLVYAYGGFEEFVRVTTDYLVDQSRRESLVLGASQSGWIRQFSRAVIWNGLGVVGWIWALPWFLASPQRRDLFNAKGLFLLIWLLPGLVAFTLIHVAAPGHTLASIPVWCIAGAFVLRTAAQRWKPIGGREPVLADAPLVFAVSINLLLFLNNFPLPANPAPSRGMIESLKNAAAFGTFETSLGMVLWVDDVARDTLEEVNAYIATDRPTVIVTQDVHEKEWFLNWRILRYYHPAREIWIAVEHKSPAELILARRDQASSIQTGSPVTAQLPPSVRILWLLEPGGRFQRELSKAASLKGGQRIFYTDLDETSGPLRVLDFVFAPGGDSRARDGIQ